MEARQANTEGAGAINSARPDPAGAAAQPRRIIVGEVRDTEIRPMPEATTLCRKDPWRSFTPTPQTEVFGLILMLAQRGS